MIFVSFFFLVLDSLVVCQYYCTSPHHPINPHHLPPPLQAAHILISWPNEAGALSAKLNQWESASMPRLFHFSHQQSQESEFASGPVFVPFLVLILFCIHAHFACKCACMCMHNTIISCLNMVFSHCFIKKPFVCGILPFTTIKGIRLPLTHKSHHRLYLH